MPCRIRLLSTVRAGQELLRLGLHHPLEDLVLDDGPVGEHDPPLHHLLEALGALHLFVEPGEELEGGPGHHGVDQLVPAAGEGAVDGGPRHLGLPGGVLDGGLGQSPAGHAGVGGLEDPLAGVVHRRRRSAQSPSSGSRPTVSPGRLGHRPDGQHHPVHERRPVVGVVADGQALPHCPEDHLLMGHQPGEPDRVDAHPGRARRPRGRRPAPRSRSGRAGSRRIPTRVRAAGHPLGRLPRRARRGVELARRGGAR